MHEALLSDVEPNLGHITQKVVLNLLFPMYLLEVFPIERFWNMTLISLLSIFLVYFSFLDAPCDLCNGLHGQHHLLSKNLRHNVLPVLEFSIPPEHPDEFLVYHLWIIKITMDATKQ